MRRASLPPPRRVADPALERPIRRIQSTDAVSATLRGKIAATDHRGPDGLEHRPLPGPRPARPRHRRLFHPVTGWFRRFERTAEHLLSTHVYPLVPGLPFVYSRALERHLTLVEGDVAIAGLPAGFDGARVLLITDVHLGPFLSPPALERVFARLLSADPDLVLLGGDLTTAKIDEFPAGAAAFRSLRAPLGVFAVLGNHDHYTGHPERLRGLLADCGVRVLHNSAVSLETPGGPDGDPARLVVAGIDDLHAGSPDLDAALAQASPGAPVVLLSHNPDVVFGAARRGVRLVLSGHTHGGQIRIPGLPVLVRMSRYRLDEGHYVAGATHLIVSRGLGVTGLPVRLFCPPEAVLITLRRASSPSA